MHRPRQIFCVDKDTRPELIHSDTHKRRGEGQRLGKKVGIRSVHQASTVSSFLGSTSGSVLNADGAADVASSAAVVVGGGTVGGVGSVSAEVEPGMIFSPPPSVLPAKRSDMLLADF
jgi:hypothetical protein